MHIFSFDLHVLGTPPAFILSQDQTLRVCPFQIPLLVPVGLLVISAIYAQHRLLGLAFLRGVFFLPACFRTYHFCDC